MSPEIEKIMSATPTEDQFMVLFAGAAKRILPIYLGKEDQEVVYKADGSLQTKADRILDEMFVNYFTTNTPYSVISEEAYVGNKEYKFETFWTIDPNDGTRGFMDQTGEFAFMIGLVHKGNPILGAVYLPLKGKMYFAKDGCGAFLYKTDGSKSVLGVSSRCYTPQMRMVVSRVHGETDFEVGKRLKVARVETHDSFGIKAGMVAEGEADIYLNSSGETSILDSAPNIVIVRELGGESTDLNGDRLVIDPRQRYNEFGVVMTNGLGHREIVDRIRVLLDEMRAEQAVG